jgi:hypothetical protein
MPLRAAVEQIDGAGRALAGDLDARDLVADFKRQVKAGRRLARILADGEGCFAERLAAPGEGLDHARAGAFGDAQHASRKLAALGGSLTESEGGVVALGTQHGKTARASGKVLERRGEAVALAIVEPVGEPKHI